MAGDDVETTEQLARLLWSNHDDDNIDDLNHDEGDLSRDIDLINKFVQVRIQAARLELVTEVDKLKVELEEARRLASSQATMHVRQLNKAELLTQTLGLIKSTTPLPEERVKALELENGRLAKQLDVCRQRMESAERYQEWGWRKARETEVKRVAIERRLVEMVKAAEWPLSASEWEELAELADIPGESQARMEELLDRVKSFLDNLRTVAQRQLTGTEPIARLEDWKRALAVTIIDSLPEGWRVEAKNDDGDPEVSIVRTPRQPISCDMCQPVIAGKHAEGCPVANVPEQPFELTAEFVARCICTEDGLEDCDTTRAEAIKLIAQYGDLRSDVAQKHTSEVYQKLLADKRTECDGWMARVKEEQQRAETAVRERDDWKAHYESVSSKNDAAAEQWTTMKAERDIAVRELTEVADLGPRARELRALHGEECRCVPCSLAGILDRHIQKAGDSDGSPVDIGGGSHSSDSTNVAPSVTTRIPAGRCKCGLQELQEGIHGSHWYWALHTRDACTLELPDERCWCGRLRSEHQNAEGHDPQAQETSDAFTAKDLNHIDGSEHEQLTSSQVIARVRSHWHLGQRQLDEQSAINDVERYAQQEVANAITKQFEAHAKKHAVREAEIARMQNVLALLTDVARIRDTELAKLRADLVQSQALVASLELSRVDERLQRAVLAAQEWLKNYSIGAVSFATERAVSQDHAARLAVALHEALAVSPPAQADNAEVVKPIAMRLTCPNCGFLHIDEGEFATKVHHTHSCQNCGLTWRPAVVPTVGVLFLPGFKNKMPHEDDQGTALPTLAEIKTTNAVPVTANSTFHMIWRLDCIEKWIALHDGSKG